MIDIAYDRRTKTDPYVLYKQKDTEAYLRHEKVPSVRFYGEDYVDYSQSSEIKEVSQSQAQTLTIRFWLIGKAVQPEEGDLIRALKDGTLWKINNIVITDDGQMKEHSLRPRTYYIASLMRTRGNSNER